MVNQAKAGQAMINCILTADIHLTDARRDSYRFDLFPFLAKQAKKYKVDRIYFLGDITDAKDHHSSKLVNQTVAAYQSLPVPSTILMGNHDFKDPNHPFFNFLNFVPNVEFISKPLFKTKESVLCLPHTKDIEAWDDYRNQMEKAEYIFIHQTVNGALASNGHALPGLPLDLFDDLDGQVYSGDIHVPQIIGSVTYVGSPYTVHHDDKFEPRILLLQNGKETDLYFDTVRKWSLEIGDVDELYKNKKLREGDQIVITVKLTREEAVEWRNHKEAVLQACQELGLELNGLKYTLPKRVAIKRARLDDTIEDSDVPRKPEDILRAFCKREQVGVRLRDAGLAYLED